jgi:hypothetical protein
LSSLPVQIPLRPDSLDGHLAAAMALNLVALVDVCTFSLQLHWFRAHVHSGLSVFAAYAMVHSGWYVLVVSATH